MPQKTENDLEIIIALIEKLGTPGNLREILGKADMQFFIDYLVKKYPNKAYSIGDEIEERGMQLKAARILLEKEGDWWRAYSRGTRLGDKKLVKEAKQMMIDEDPKFAYKKAKDSKDRRFLKKARDEFVTREPFEALKEGSFSHYRYPYYDRKLVIQASWAVLEKISVEDKKFYGIMHEIETAATEFKDRKLMTALGYFIIEAYPESAYELGIKARNKELASKAAYMMLDKNPLGAYDAAVHLKDNELKEQARKRYFEKKRSASEIYHAAMGHFEDKKLAAQMREGYADEDPIRAYRVGAGIGYNHRDRILARKALKRIIRANNLEGLEKEIKGLWGR